MGDLDEALRLAGAAWEDWHGAGRRYTVLKTETLDLHTGRVHAATATTGRQFTGFVANRYEPYVRAVRAELAVIAGLPDAAERLSAAASAADQNDWAVASLARAHGRLYHDQTQLTASVEGWELIGARFERACTVLLIPDRANEGRTELAAIGVPQPAHVPLSPDAHSPGSPAQDRPIQ
jgi:hypothetical protein